MIIMTRPTAFQIPFLIRQRGTSTTRRAGPRGNTQAQLIARATSERVVMSGAANGFCELQIAPNVTRPVPALPLLAL